MMHLEILQVPDCPNVQLLEQRIEHVLAEESIDWELRHVIVDDRSRSGVRGSVLAARGRVARRRKVRMRRW